MRHISLASEILFKNIKSYIILFVLVFLSLYLVTLQLCNLVRYLPELNPYLEEYDTSTRNGGYVIDVMGVDSLDQDGYRNARNEIAAIEGVSTVSRIGTLNCTVDQVFGKVKCSLDFLSEECRIYYFSEDVYRLMPFEIIEGRNINYSNNTENSTEILLSDTFMPYYDVGDCIKTDMVNWFQLTQDEWTKEHEEYMETGISTEDKFSEKLVIVGFFSAENSKIVDFTIKNSNQLFLVRPPYANTIIYSRNYDGVGGEMNFYITLKDGLTSSEKEKTLFLISEYGDVYEYRYLYTHMLEAAYTALRKYLPSIILIIVSCLICLTVCSAVNTYKSLEMFSVFRICGASKASCLNMISFINSFVIILAFAAGFSYSQKLNAEHAYADLGIKVTDYISGYVFAVFVLFLLLALVLPILLFPKKKLLEYKTND